MIAVLVVLIVVVIVFCGLIVLAQGDAKHTGPSSQASGTPVVEGDLTYTSNTIVFGVPSRVVNHLCFFADGDSFTDAANSRERVSGDDTNHWKSSSSAEATRLKVDSQTERRSILLRDRSVTVEPS